MSFKSFGTVADSAAHLGTDPFILQMPSGVVDGDFLLMVAYRGNHNGNFVLPAGWTAIPELEQINSVSDNLKTLTAYRVASNEPTSYTLTHTEAATRTQSAVIVAYEQLEAGLFDVVPISAHSAKYSNNNNMAVPAITTTTANSILIAIQWASNAEVTTPAPPVDFSLRVSHSPFNDRNIFIADKTQATAEAINAGTWQHAASAQFADGATAILALKTVQPNQAPTADDDTFTIKSNAQNGSTVGTFTATDADGTIVSYSIDNAALAIDNAGLITLVDNTGLTAGVDITATVTATDNDGATDTALITIQVVAPFPTITSVTPIRLGEAFTITVDNEVDLTTQTNITATLGGIDCGTASNITTNTATFTAPSEGLELNAAHDLILGVR